MITWDSPNFTQSNHLTFFSLREAFQKAKVVTWWTLTTLTITYYFDHVRAILSHFVRSMRRCRKGKKPLDEHFQQWPCGPLRAENWIDVLETFLDAVSTKWLWPFRKVICVCFFSWKMLRKRLGQVELLMKVNSLIDSLANHVIDFFFLNTQKSQHFCLLRFRCSFPKIQIGFAILQFNTPWHVVDVPSLQNLSSKFKNIYCKKYTNMRVW